jgi:hypothetical protein
MNKSSVYILGLGIVVILTLGLWFFSGENEVEQKTSKLYVSDNWTQQYGIGDKRPYGLNLLYQWLDQYSDSSQRIIDEDLNKNLKDSMQTYLFIGKDFVLKNNELDSILEKVKKGNNLILSFSELGENMHSKFFQKTYKEWYYNPFITLYDTQENPLTLHHVFQADTIATKWNLWNEWTINDSVYSVLGTAMDEMVYFYEIPYENGHIYLHSIPEAFFNYQLLSKEGIKHTERVFSFIPKNHEICWLELGRYVKPDFEEDEDDADGDKKDTSLLQFIFQHKALLFAFLVTILGLLLFLLFRSKRSKPIVPYIPKTKNRSVAFADTMKEIYYQQSSPYNLLQVMKKNFFVSINKQFYIDISKKETRSVDLILLSEKSAIPIEKIQEILDLYETTEAFSISNDYLSKVNILQRDFYLETGIIKEKLEQALNQRKRDFRSNVLIPSSSLLLGIIIILKGLYLLASANGFGIIYWPIGMLFCYMAVRLFSYPIASLEGQTLIQYRIFGRKRTFLFSDIVAIDSNPMVCEFKMENGKIIKVNTWLISKYDKQSFLRILNVWKKDNVKI